VKPIDPRLLRYARATTGYLAGSVVLGAIGALAIVAGAFALADVVSGVVAGESLRTLRPGLVVLVVVAVIRALVAWLGEGWAYRTAASAKVQLRRAVADRVLTDPASAGDRSLAITVTRGLDALDAYYMRYLPQLVLAFLVPVVVLAAMVTQDLLSAFIVAVTLPLIPLFMALVGVATRAATGRQLARLTRLSNFFLDLVAGLPTLTVMGRATAQQRRVAEMTEAYRSATMRVLRISFLSALVLELLATISVALVAVSIGVRLVESGLDLRTGLVVLVLAPEAYLPLRLVGLHYHASADALAAADELLDLVEAEPQPRGQRPAPDLRGTALRLDQVGVSYPDRALPALQDFSLTVSPGEKVALVGPSGSGKSTALALLLGFERPTSGRVLLQRDGADVDVTDLDPDSLRAQIAWLPQLPVLFGPTLRAALTAGTPTDETRLQELLERVGMADAVAGLPNGLDTQLPERLPLSAGQRQRLAIVRTLLRPAPVLLLDEPTAGLDGSTERQVLDLLSAECADRTVLLVAHRPSLLTLADRQVRVEVAAVVA
jgi:thiol reductant ABC exporter CydD subunit